MLDSMRDWMEQSLASLSRKSDVAAAIRYARTLWDALTRYAADGIVEIDNSAGEPALRVVALGRKNGLFAGSDRRGERAAAVYALIGTTTLDGIAPRKSNCGITKQNALDADSLPHLADLIDCGEIAIETSPQLAAVTLYSNPRQTFTRTLSGV